MLSFSFPPPHPTPCLFFSSLPGQFYNFGMQPECLSLLAWAGCETPAAHYRRGGEGGGDEKKSTVIGKVMTIHFFVLTH